MPVLNNLNDSDQSSEEPKKFTPAVYYATPASYFLNSHYTSSTVQYLAWFHNHNRSIIQYDNQSQQLPTSPPSNINTFTTPAYTPTQNSSDANGNFAEKSLTNLPSLAKKLKPALVYIFNHENFDTGNEARNGSAQDEDALVKTFDQLKCEVQVIKDATVATIKSMVQILESKCFEEQSALVIVVLTHGWRHDKLAAKDSEYSLDDDVIFPILRNQTLMNKPKLVIVQACKGARELGGFKTDAVQPHGSPNEIYKCYSTYEGYVSYRTEDGTPFIQTLCEALQKSGRTKDIDSIMTEVRTAVKANTQDGQIPSVTSTLTSTYVFGDYM